VLRVSQINQLVNGADHALTLESVTAKLRLLHFVVLLQVETFVDSDAVHGAVRSSIAGMARRRSIQKARSNLIGKVSGIGYRFNMFVVIMPTQFAAAESFPNRV
jgi:hypothetical protein